MKNAFLVCSLLCAVMLMLPCMGQPDDAQVPGQADERSRELKEQQQRAIDELFRDVHLQLLELDNELAPRERIEEERRIMEEMQQRVVDIQHEHPREGLVQQRRAADPIQLDAKPRANPWEQRPRAEVVAALGHAEHAMRQSAQDCLLADDTIDQAVLKELIKQADSPEQQQRLLHVAEHHLLREMRERDFGKAPEGVDPVAALNRQARPAAVGYSYEPVLADENPFERLAGVRVIATMPGFPGHVHLRQGDIIVQIAGHRPAVHHQHHEITQWVRWRISAHEAGDTIEFVVIRGGELVSLELVCAQVQALNHMYTTDAFETAARKEPYRRAWDNKREALMQLMPKPKVLTPTASDGAE